MRWRYVAVLILVPSLLVLRLVAGGFDFDQVWAEDGRVFLRDVRMFGAESILYTFAGYLHAVPRLLALAGSPLDLADWAAFTVLSSIAVVTLLAVFVFAACVRLLGSSRWAFLPALGMALVPAAAVEVIGNLANLQWFFLPAAFAALALGPGLSGWLRYVAPAVALLAALTSPLALFALPAALVRGRSGWRSWQVAALLVGLTAQAAAILLAPESDLILSREPAVRPRFAADFLVGVLGPARPGGGGQLSAAVSAVVGAMVLAGLVLLWRAAISGHRLATCAAVSAVTFFGFAAVVTGLAPARYQVAAAVLLLFGVAALAAAAPRHSAVVVGVCAVLAAVSFPVAPLRVSGPEWTAPAERADLECAGGAERTSDLHVSPEDWYAARFQVPCD